MIRFDNISCFSINELFKINNESENNDKLIKLYKDRGFKIFNIRKSKSGEERKLIQMYRLI